MRPCLSRLLLLLVVLGMMPSCRPQRSSSIRQVYVEGDILLGGLFPIHESGRNGSVCGRLKADQGVQRMMAALYGVHEVNGAWRLLPGVSLGAQFLDTCSTEGNALRQTLELIKSVRNADGSSTASSSSFSSSERHPPLAAVVGAASSQISIMAASLLQLFDVAQVSYSSTGAELSDKSRFPLFSRVVAPDSLQATALASIVARLGWTLVHALADTGSYGQGGVKAFQTAAAPLGVCVHGDVHTISRSATPAQLRALLLEMATTAKTARAVLTFVDEDNMRKLLAALRSLLDEHPHLQHHFWFVASDSWGVKQSVVKGFEDLTAGTISVAPPTRRVPGFDDFFLNQQPVNTFLAEYWRDLGCDQTLATDFRSCFRAVNATFRQEAYVPFVVDSIRVIASALATYIDQDCGRESGRLRFHAARCNLSTIGFSGRRLQNLYRGQPLRPQERATIDENGDGLGHYEVFQLNKRGTYRKMGEWRADTEFLDLKVDGLRRGLLGWTPSAAQPLPLSICSRPCAEGFYRVYQHHTTCCWTCVPCDPVTSIVVNETLCVECEIGFVGAGDRCRRLIPQWLDWKSAWTMTPAIVAVVGLMLSVFVLGVLLRFSRTPVVMASGRELCYCMIAGCAGTYLCTFVLTAPPSHVSCGLSRVLIGFSMSLIYAAILTKTNRLSRVFRPASAQPLRCISPKAQVFLCLSLVSVQLVGSLIWLIFDPPQTTIVYPTRAEAVLACNAKAPQLLLSLLYNMFLIVACTVYAFKTRKIPENFNETRLIGFTMYSTCILWLSFAPIYAATQNNFRIQLVSLCMCINLSGYVALGCFFVPKLYIVLLQPEKNVRNRQSAVGRLVGQQFKFMSHLAVQPESSFSAAVTHDASSHIPILAHRDNSCRGRIETTMFIPPKTASLTCQVGADSMIDRVSIRGSSIHQRGSLHPCNSGSTMGSASRKTSEVVEDQPLLHSLPPITYAAVDRSSEGDLSIVEEDDNRETNYNKEESPRTEAVRRLLDLLTANSPSTFL